MTWHIKIFDTPPFFELNPISELLNYVIYGNLHSQQQYIFRSSENDSKWKRGAKSTNFGVFQSLKTFYIRNQETILQKMITNS